LQKVVGDPEIEAKGIIYNKMTQVLVYANAIIWRSIDLLKETMKKLTKAANVMGLCQRAEDKIYGTNKKTNIEQSVKSQRQGI
jgi:hypothetical protein